MGGGGGAGGSTPSLSPAPPSHDSSTWWAVGGGATFPDLLASNRKHAGAFQELHRRRRQKRSPYENMYFIFLT